MLQRGNPAHDTNRLPLFLTSCFTFSTSVNNDNNFQQQIFVEFLLCSRHCSRSQHTMTKHTAIPAFMQLTFQGGEIDHMINKYLR